jgi:hypothetical protein
VTQCTEEQKLYLQQINLQTSGLMNNRAKNASTCFKHSPNDYNIIYSSVRTGSMEY